MDSGWKTLVVEFESKLDLKITCSEIVGIGAKIEIGNTNYLELMSKPNYFKNTNASTHIRCSTNFLRRIILCCVILPTRDENIRLYNKSSQNNEYTPKIIYPHIRCLTIGLKIFVEKSGKHRIYVDALRKYTQNHTGLSRLFQSK